jgi:hypothetical protein
VEAVVIGSGRLQAMVAVAIIAATCALACAPGATCGLRQCDIRQPDCQRDNVRATACLRGQAAVDFPVTVKPQDVFIAEAEAEAAAVTDAEREHFRTWQRGLALLGLGDPDVTLMQSVREQALWVAAYYEPDKKAVTVIDGGQPLDSQEAVTVLVHEAAHALQDHTVGLAAFLARFPEDLDRLLASKAVTEGEASVIEDQAALGLFGGRDEDVAWGSVFGYWQLWSRQQAQRSAMPVYLAWGQFPYPYGTPYALAAYQAQGLAGLDALYTQPPANAAQVLAGYAAPAPVGVPWSEELGDLSVPQAAAPYAYFDGDRLGAWMWLVFCDRLINRSAVRGGASALIRSRTALTADRFSILRDPSGGQLLAAWRLRFDSASLATQLAQVLTADGWKVAAIERDLVVLGGTWPIEPAQVSFGPIPPASSLRSPLQAAATHRCARRLPRGK